MPDYDLGTATGKIKIDASGAVAGSVQANAALESVEGKSKSTNVAMGALGAGMVGAGAALAGGLVIAIGAAANFEKQISAIGAVSGATGDELDAVRDKALRLGADTAFSASEAAGAMEELIKAGLTTEEVLNGAADATVALAAAGEVDLATAATIAANAMNQFNLEAEDMGHVADLIAGAANASAIDVGDFGLAMSQAGATANLVGLSFDDLAVAIAAMGNAGIKGSDAGTSLKTMLSNLQPTTDKQIDTMRDLGLVWEENGVLMNKFFDEAGQVKGIGEIAGELETALAGLTDQQKALALETIFGSDAIRAAAIIADTGAAGFDTLAESMGKVTAEDVAAARLDNFAGSMEQLKGSMETLLITIGTNFLGPLRTVVDFITQYINKLGELNPELLKWISYTAAVGSVLLILGGSLILVQKYVSSLLIALRPMIALIGAVSIPVLIAIAVIAALAAGIYYLWQNSETFREGVRGLRDDLMEAWGWVQDNVLPLLKEWAAIFVNELLPVMVDFANRVWEVLQSIADVLVDVIIPALVDFAGEVQKVAKAVINWLQKHVFNTFFAMGELVVAVVERIIETIRFLYPAFKLAFDGIMTVVRTVLVGVQNIIMTFIGAVLIIWRNFGDEIFRIIKLAWDFVIGLIGVVVDQFRGFIQILTGIFQGDWKKVWEGVQTVATAPLEAVKLVAETVMEAIRIAVSAVDSAIRAFWELLWLFVRNTVETALNILKTFVEGSINGIVGFFAGMKDRILGAFGGALDWLWQKGKDLIDGLKAGIDIAWNAVTTFFEDLPTEALEKVGDIAMSLWNAGWDFINGFFRGLKARWDEVQDWFEEKINWVNEKWDEVFVIDSPSKVMAHKGEMIIAGLVEGLDKAWPDMVRQMNAINSDISNSSLVDPTSTGAAAFPMNSGAGGEGVTIHFNFGNLTDPNAAAAVQSAVSSPETLNAIVRAVRAGRR